MPPVRAPPKGPDSFVLTYKFFETELPRELATPLRGWRPPTGNPGSAAVMDGELDEAGSKVVNPNTAYLDKKWEKVFKDFLKENDMNDDFYDFDIPTPDKWVGKLWFRARQNNQEYTRY